MRNRKCPNSAMLPTICSPEASTNLARAYSCGNTGNTEYSRMQRPMMEKVPHQNSHSCGVHWSELTSFQSSERCIMQL